jgi:hypothetical protein
MSIAYLVGCATTPVNKSGGPSSNTISATDIASINATSAYDVVAQLRPNWLRPSVGASSGIGSTSGSTNVRVPKVVVYLDGLKFGTAQDLTSIRAAELRSMEFLTASRAMMVVRDLSTDADAVIMVNTKK